MIPRIKAFYKTAYPDQDMASAEIAITAIRDVLFTCNIWNVIYAYSSSSFSIPADHHIHPLIATSPRNPSDYNPTTIYAVQYSLPPGTHGVDVPALWHTMITLFSLWPFSTSNSDSTTTTTNNNNVMKIWTHYQTYLTSHARSRTGNPNTFGASSPIKWPTVGHEPAEEYVRNTLNVTEKGNGFKIIEDRQVRTSVCRMWNGVWEDVTRLGGYM